MSADTGRCYCGHDARYHANEFIGRTACQAAGCRCDGYQAPAPPPADEGDPHVRAA